MFLVWLALAFAALLWIIVVTDVLDVSMNSRPGVDGDVGQITRRFYDQFVLLGLSIIPLLSGLALSIQNFFTNNWKLLLGLLVAGFVGAAYVATQPSVDKASDAAETTVQWPFAKFFLIPVSNALRIVYDGVICWSNFLSSITRVVQYNFFVLARDCDDMDWTVTANAIVNIFVEFFTSFVNFIISGFRDDFAMTPVYNEIANVFSSLVPVLDCNCKDLDFTWGFLIDEEDGLIQSKNLHNAIDLTWVPFVTLIAPPPVWSVVAGGNIQFEAWRVHINTIVDVGDSIFTNPCGDLVQGEFPSVTLLNGTTVPGYTAPETSEEFDLRVWQCRTGRQPDYGRLQDMTCAYYGHVLGILDDALFKLINTFVEFFDPSITAETPRLGAVIAPLFCLQSDILFNVLDGILHVDLFFSVEYQSGVQGTGNYLLAVDYQRPFSRLYNVSQQLENVGDSLSYDVIDNFPFHLTRLLAEPLNITFAAIQIPTEIVRHSLGTFNEQSIKNFLGGELIDELVQGIVRDAQDIVDSLEQLGESIDDVTKQFFSSFAEMFSDFAVYIRNFSKALSQDQVRDYLGGTGAFAGASLQGDTDRLLNHSKALSIAAGNLVRQLGVGVGSTTCTVRGQYSGGNPGSLDEIPSVDGDDLNVLCVLGNIIETSIKFVIALVEWVTKSLTFLLQDFANYGPFNAVPNWLERFRSNDVNTGNALTKEDGVIPTLCVLLDQVAGVFPALINLVEPTPECPNNGVDVATVVHNVLKRLARLVLVIPSSVDTVIRAYAFGADPANAVLNFGEACETVFVSGYVSTVAPFIDLFAEFFVVQTCYLPGEAGDVFNSIGLFIREAFVDTSGDTDSCGAAFDGGRAMDGICTFIEFIEQAVRFIFRIRDVGPFAALWEIIVEAVESLWNKFVAVFECFINGINGLFRDIGRCLKSCVDPDFTEKTSFPFFEIDICDRCNIDFSGRFDCTSEFEGEVVQPIDPFGEVPEIEPNQPEIIPDPGELYGSCCASDGVCSGDQGVNPTTADQCAGTGVSIFVAGKACGDHNVCDGVALNASAVLQEGACCIPNTACQNLNYTDCVGVGADSVFVPGETCDAVNAQCALVNSPQAVEVLRGCCVTSSGVTPFDAFSRRFVPALTGFECWTLNGDDAPDGLRAFYVPGDTDCSFIQTTALGARLADPNATLAAMDDVDNFDGTSPETFFFDYNATATPCTPHQYVDNSIYTRMRHMGCKVTRSATTPPNLYRPAYVLSGSTSAAQNSGGGCIWNQDNDVNTCNADPTAHEIDTGLWWQCREPGAVAYFRPITCWNVFASADCSPVADKALVPAIPSSVSSATKTALLQDAFAMSFNDFDQCPKIAGYRYNCWRAITRSTFSQYAQRQFGVDNVIGDVPGDALHMSFLDRITAKEDYNPGSSLSQIRNGESGWKAMRIVHFSSDFGGPEFAPPLSATIDHSDSFCNTFYYDETVDQFNLPPVTTGATTGATTGFATTGSAATGAATTGSSATGAATTGAAVTTGSVTTGAPVSPDMYEPPATIEDPGLVTRRRQVFFDNFLAHEDEAVQVMRRELYLGNDTNASATTNSTGNVTKPSYWNATVEQREAHYDMEEYYMFIIERDNDNMGIVSELQVSAVDMPVFSGNLSNPRHPCHWHYNKLKRLVREVDNTTIEYELHKYAWDLQIEWCMLSSFVSVGIDLAMGKPDFFAKPLIPRDILMRPVTAIKTFQSVYLCLPAIVGYGTKVLERSEETQNCTWYTFLEMNYPELANDTICRGLGLRAEGTVNATIRFQTHGIRMPTALQGHNLFVKLYEILYGRVVPRQLTPAPSAELYLPPGSVNGTYHGSLHDIPLSVLQALNQTSGGADNETMTGDEFGGTTGRALLSYIPQNASLYQNASWQKAHFAKARSDNLARFISEHMRLNQAAHRLAAGNYETLVLAQNSIDINPCTQSRVGELCVDCDIVIESIEDLVELVLDCADVYIDPPDNRFDVFAVEFPRDNTFKLPGETFKCEGADFPQIYDDLGFINATFNVLDTIFGDARGVFADAVCAITTFDTDDPSTVWYWPSFLLRCDFRTHGSCSKGRAGLGIVTAAWQVGLAFAILTFFLTQVSPISIPIPYIGFLYVLFVFVFAYHWSPACMLPSTFYPLGIYPDCIGRDLVELLFGVYGDGDCRAYDTTLVSKTCSNEGRDFPRCSELYGFDVLGVRQLFFALNLISPNITSYLYNTEFIGLSWISALPIAGEALESVATTVPAKEVEVGGATVFVADPDKDELFCFEKTVYSIPLAIILLTLSSGVLYIGLSLGVFLVQWLARSVALLALWLNSIVLLFASYHQAKRVTYRGDSRLVPDMGIPGADGEGMQIDTVIINDDDNSATAAAARRRRPRDGQLF